MLVQIRNYIRREGIVSTQQLSREFKVELTALQPMLDVWLYKGVINKCVQNIACRRACFKCRTPVEYYEYITA